MVSQGLQQEISNLLKAGVAPEAQAMKGIGYKELLPVLAGSEADMQQAIAKIQQNSRYFAKRQLTWYRRMPYIHWYQPELYRNTGKLADNLLWDVQRWMRRN